MASGPRVTFVTCTYPPYAGGMGNVAARHAGMLADSGINVTVLTPAFDGPHGTQLENGIRIERLPVVFRHGNSAVVRGIARHVKHSDLVYIHYPFYGGAEVAALACRIHGIPYGVFVHMDVHRTGAVGALLSLHSRTLHPWVLKGAQCVMVSSLDYAKSTSVGRLGLESLTESPYAPPERFSPGDADADALRRLGLDHDRPAFLFVGAMDVDHSFKGIPELLQAFDPLRVHPARPMLILAGGGGRQSEYEQQASHAPEDIRFLGRVSDDDLVALYRRAYATVLPSISGDEAYGIVLAEGMACGAPGIATALPGVRTVLNDGVTGVLVPPGDVKALRDQMRAMLDNPETRADMAKAGLMDRDTRLSPDRERERIMRTLGLVGKSAVSPPT